MFEDDVKFIWENNPIENLGLAVKQASTLKWQLFYLGANTHQKLIKFNKNLIMLKNGFAVHSMAYDNSIYDKFINYAENTNEIRQFNDVLDVYLANQIQSQHLCLMVNPILTTQRESYSDIEKTNVNYEFIIDRFNQNIK